MGKLYLLFKTDDIQEEIVAAHESLVVLEQYLMNNHDLGEPEKIGQGWKIDLLTYDSNGKSHLKLIKKYTKELAMCSPENIEEESYYNIVYRIVQGSDSLPMRILKAKCIKASPPNYVFVKQNTSDFHLRYADIIVIEKCRENEDCDDGDRFIYYSHLYQWKMEHDN